MRRLPIANPCHENWEAMRPDGARRFCEVCQKNVHDLSSMTPGQAERLLADERRELCVRFLHDGEDVVHMSPAPRDPARSVGWSAGMAAGLVAGLLASCTPHGKPPVEAYDWGDQAVTASVHDGVVIPAARDVVGDEPCGTSEPEAEPDPNQHRAIKGLRKKMGKRKAPTPKEDFAEIVGDGL